MVSRPDVLLDLVVPIGIQVTEVLHRHQDLKGDAARTAATELLARVGIGSDSPVEGVSPPAPRGHAPSAPSSMALACQPRLLIADEPTDGPGRDPGPDPRTAEGTRSRPGAALVMITHDLGVIAGLCDTVHVMYGGRVVESPGAGAVRRAAPPLHRRAARVSSPPGRSAAPRSQARRPTCCRGRRGAHSRPGAPTGSSPTERPPDLESASSRELRRYNPLVAAEEGSRVSATEGAAASATGAGRASRSVTVVRCRRRTRCSRCGASRCTSRSSPGSSSTALSGG